MKTIVDYIALYKFNYFHIHLTEDQGWRFESKLYPKLTIKGCKRSHTNFGFKKEEGFYTQEQLKELVDYCHKRYIKVIPEIDMPGHTMSALACYPELSCFDSCHIICKINLKLLHIVKFKFGKLFLAMLTHRPTQF